MKYKNEVKEKKYEDEVKNKNYEKNISKFILKMIVIALLTIVLIPIILEYLIYRNDFVSILSNAEWSGFFGSFIGSIIGAVIAGTVTIYGIRLTINHNTKIVMQERFLQESKEYDKELKLNRPFIYLKHKGNGGGIQGTHFLGKSTNNIIKHNFELINIGMNTAVDINYNTNYCGSDKIKKSNLFNNKQIILKHDSFNFDIGIPDDGKGHDIVIRFRDLLENQYEQKIIFGQENDKYTVYSCAPTLKDI